MVKAKKETEIGDVLVHAPEEAILPVVLLGRSPLIINRLAEKARQELLYPAGPKNAAERQSRLKHNPIEEFRSSVHQIADPTAATLLAMPGSAIKRALASAALDIPGAKKAQVGRLTYVPEQLVFQSTRPVWGATLGPRASSSMASCFNPRAPCGARP